MNNNVSEILTEYLRWNKILTLNILNKSMARLLKRLFQFGFNVVCMQVIEFTTGSSTTIPSLYKIKQMVIF